MPSPYTSTKTPWRVMRGASSMFRTLSRLPIKTQVASLERSSATLYFWASSTISGNGVSSSLRETITAGGICPNRWSSAS